MRGSGYPNHHVRCVDLIAYFSVQLAVLSAQGREFPSPGLRRCPACGSARPWGHGYAQRFFDGLSEAVWVKCWRCTACRAVHTMRPATHWRGSWAARALILESLQGRVKGCPRSRVKANSTWWKGFAQQSARKRLEDPCPAVLRRLVRKRVILATHSLKYRDVRPLPAYTPPDLCGNTGPGGGAGSCTSPFECRFWGIKDKTIVSFLPRYVKAQNAD